MSVRCKFKCDTKIETEHGYEVGFCPVTSGSAENESFFKWTPYGELKFGTLNKEASDQFEVGKEYYLDLSVSA
ncbi:MAG: hypothetical protein GYB19_10220 [Rhodospirillales bacterium]|nr:hypothetical protein [Rhodospirillales bacterium]